MQFGALSVNPKDGSIISLYAGDDYLTKQLNNVTQATYEVGSTMKPFALLGRRQRRRQPQHVLQRQLVPDVPGASPKR